MGISQESWKEQEEQLQIREPIQGFKDNAMVLTANETCQCQRHLQENLAEVKSMLETPRIYGALRFLSILLLPHRLLTWTLHSTQSTEGR